MAALGPNDKRLLPYPEKTCNTCGLTKSVLYFPKRSGLYLKYKPKDVRRYDTQCKRCKKPARPGQSREDVAEVRMRRAARGKGHTKKPKRRKKALSPSEYKRKVRAETRVKSMAYLAGKGCAECGERDPRKLEYDHKEPGDKKQVIAKLITDGYSWSASVLRAEIRKCRILCASCHRLHTIKQQGYYADPRVQTELGRLAAKHGFDL